MTTIKSYTDLEQSRKLAKIISPTTADAFYRGRSWNNNTYVIIQRENIIFPDVYDIPCWSLAALLKYLSEIKPQVYTPILFSSEDKWILEFTEYGHGNVCKVSCNNPIDACYEMIIKLHELKML